jgi:1-acyl-sn-glycerol-3-phosphate acyltransferase
VGKQSLKLVPVVGWCWIFTESIFLRRIWESDRETLVNDLRKILANYPENYYFNVKKKIIFNFFIHHFIYFNSNLVFTFL